MIQPQITAIQSNNSRAGVPVSAERRKNLDDLTLKLKQDISVYHLQIHTPDQVWDFKTIKRAKDKNDRNLCKRPFTRK